MRSRSTTWRLALLVALLGAGFGLSRTFGDVFAHGWLGHNGARYTHIARNYLRDGLLFAHGAPRMDVAPAAGRTAPPEVAAYAHHPPGLSMALALVFRVTGVGEDAARGVAALATLLALLLLWRLVAGEAGAEAAALAVLAAAAMPMVHLYGAHVDVQGPPVLALSLLVVLLYRRWLGGAAAWPLLLAAAAASAFDWYGLYAPVACAAHLALTRRRYRAAAGLVAFAAGLFLAWWAWLATLPGMDAGTLWRAAAVRGARLFEGDGDDVRRLLAAWWEDTRRLMPGWPALLALSLLVAAGLVRPWRGDAARAPPGRPAEGAVPAPGAGTAPATLGARGLLALLLGPPIVHALVFPAGLIVHDYWLFALPYGIAMGYALALQRLRPALALAAVLVLVPAGVAGSATILARREALPALVGQALGAHTAPGDVVLTNFDTNPFVAGGSGDEHVDKFPEVTFYADRAVRGGIGDPDALAAALARRPDARWFLATPWPPVPADPALLAAVGARAGQAPERLANDPPVDLFRLDR